MKRKEYVLLKSLYYDKREEYEALYKSRVNADECVSLNFSINDNQAFFMKTTELLEEALEITRIDKSVSKLVNELPPIALRQYINKCLIDEIVITNNIEGVHSTRKEIGEILYDLEGKSKKRFLGLVKKYCALLTGVDFSISNSSDLRELYDEMFLPEIIQEDPKDAPDGKIFRIGPVHVISPSQKIIHEGILPEAKIIRSMNEAINILNDEEIQPLFRISIFHYLFGYIHPFYNGNGRLSRFISSFYLSKEMEQLMGYRLSYTIKEDINSYYKGFKIVNEEINKGDITPFIIMFLNLIKESAVNLKNGLTEKKNKLNTYKKHLMALPGAEDEKIYELYFVLLQASLFSEIGISVSELMENFGYSRPTMQKKLDYIDKNGLLNINKRGKSKFYELKLDVFNSMYAGRQYD